MILVDIIFSVIFIACIYCNIKYFKQGLLSTTDSCLLYISTCTSILGLISILSKYIF